jgi:hypothetical protein
LSDCFLSLTIGSAYSLLSFTVRSSTTIVTSWVDNLDKLEAVSIIVRQLQSITARDIFCLYLYMDQLGLHITLPREF